MAIGEVLVLCLSQISTIDFGDNVSEMPVSASKELLGYRNWF
jgi:hypothetical protein